MELLINGKKILTEKKDIYSLLKELNLNNDEIVVLQNDNIIKKHQYRNLILNENDKVELLNFVSGG